MVLLNSSIACVNEYIIGQTNYMCYGFANANLIATELRNLSPETFEYLFQSFNQVKVDNYFLFLIMYLSLLFMFLKTENKKYVDYTVLFIGTVIFISMTFNLIKVL